MTEKKILYIEDNEANRQLVALVLKRRPELQLSFAGVGSEGLELARQDRPDLILLDLSLPDMSGYQVLELLKTGEATSQIPVIGVSGDYPPNYPQEIGARFDHFLPKPIAIQPLYQAIDEALAV